MTAVFRLAEQHADATRAPEWCLTGQSAVAEPTAVFRLAEQHADAGAGSLAAWRLTSQSAVTIIAAGTPPPSGIFALSGTWRPCPIRAAAGGIWS